MRRVLLFSAMVMALGGISQARAADAHLRFVLFNGEKPADVLLIERKHVKEAARTFSKATYEPQVEISFDETGRARLHAFTKKHLHKRIALCVGPFTGTPGAVIMEPIAAGRIALSQLEDDKAKQLVAAINGKAAAPLPASGPCRVFAK